MKRLTEAFLKYNFVLKFKKGIEKPANFLSQNTIGAIGIFSDQWILAQEQDEFCNCIKKQMHKHTNNEQIRRVEKLRRHKTIFEETLRTDTNTDCKEGTRREEKINRKLNKRYANGLQGRDSL